MWSNQANAHCFPEHRENEGLNDNLSDKLEFTGLFVIHPPPQSCKNTIRFRMVFLLDIGIRKVDLLFRRKANPPFSIPKSSILKLSDRLVSHQSLPCVRGGGQNLRFCSEGLSIPQSRCSRDSSLYTREPWALPRQLDKLEFGEVQYGFK